MKCVILEKQKVPEDVKAKIVIRRMLGDRVAKKVLEWY